jgi:hypothetical protein
MTLAELRDNVWASLPPIRKRIVGRETADDFVTLAVENWEGEYLNACQDNQQRGVYVSSLLGHIKRLHQAASPYEPQEYGFLWTLILQAIAVSVIQYLVKWWLERSANRVMLQGWKAEMTQ